MCRWRGRPESVLHETRHRSGSHLAVTPDRTIKMHPANKERSTSVYLLARSKQLNNAYRNSQSKRIIVNNQQSRSWMYIQQVDSKVQPTDYMVEQEHQFRLQQKTFKRAQIWGEKMKKSLHRWNLDQLEPEHWKRKVRRRRDTDCHPKHTTVSVKHGRGSVVAWAHMADSGTRLWVFANDVTWQK